MLNNDDSKAAPLVSIIILTYRKFEDFFQTLQSVLGQDYPCMELIVSDDGSPDFCNEEANIGQYIDLHKRENITRIVIRSLPENRGTVKNANSAVALAQGKYIRFISPGDELLGTDCISTYVWFAQEHDAIVVAARTLTIPVGYGAVTTIGEPGIIGRLKARGARLPLVVPTQKDMKTLARMTDARQQATLMTKCIISTPSVFYSRDIFIVYGCFLEDYRLLEDMPTWPYLAARGVRVYFLNRVMARYTLSGISNGGELNGEFFKEYVHVMKNVYIANDTRFGLFASLNRKLRSRYIDFLHARNIARNSGKNVGLVTALRYADCLIAYVYVGLKYLIFNTKL